MECHSDSRSVGHVGADHDSVANTRGNLAIAAYGFLCWYAGRISFSSAFIVTVH